MSTARLDPKADAPPPSSRASIPPPPAAKAERLKQTLTFLDQLGEVTLLSGRTLRMLWKRPLEIRSTLHQMETLGVQSMGIVSLTSIFIGMVITIQFAFGLKRFGGLEYIPRVVVLSFLRDLAPTLTAVIVGGRIGSGMTAEVGAMNVTEQVDAIRDKDAYREQVSYPQNPIRSTAELKKLILEMRASLPNVQAPVLLMHSKDDAYVLPENMERIYAELVNAEGRTKLSIGGSGHVVTKDAARQQVFESALEFIQRIGGKV